jgi:hypothetical protein
MRKSKEDMIVDGLGGVPITELIEGWTFTIKEVAPYVYKVKAWNVNGYTASGAGGTADEALNNCLKRVNKFISYQKLKSEVMDKVKRVFRVGK